MAINANEWKKVVKASKLAGETVTPFLVEADKAHHAAAFADQPVPREKLSRLSGSLKSLQIEIKKTRAKCKKGVHDPVAKYLDDMSKDATKLLGETQKALVEWNDYLKSFETYVKHARTALEAVVKTPNAATVSRQKVPVEGALKWMQANFARMQRIDNDAYPRRAALISSAANVISDLERVIPKPKSASGKPLPPTPAALQRPLARAREVITGLK